MVKLQVRAQTSKTRVEKQTIGKKNTQQTALCKTI